jgi:hypothetical protein
LRRATARPTKILLLFIRNLLFDFKNGTQSTPISPVCKIAKRLSSGVVFQICPQVHDQRSSLRGDQPQSGQRIRDARRLMIAHAHTALTLA